MAINFEHIENIIGNEGLLIRFDELCSVVQHLFNSLAYEKAVKNHVTISFFMPSYCDWKDCIITLISSLGSLVFPASVFAVVCSKAPFPYSFVQVCKSSTLVTQAIQGTAIGPSLGVEVGCSSCGKRNAALKPVHATWWPTAMKYARGPTGLCTNFITQLLC